MIIILALVKAGRLVNTANCICSESPMISMVGITIDFFFKAIVALHYVPKINSKSVQKLAITKGGKKLPNAQNNDIMSQSKGVENNLS